MIGSATWHDALIEGKGDNVNGDIATPQPGTRAGPSMIYRVKQVQLILRHHLDEAVRPAGITALQYTALTVLERRENLTSAELARNSFVTPQAMADLVTALERSGLIQRARNQLNRRQLLISLTDDGHRMLARFAAPVAAIEERMLEGLDPDERRRFRQYLDRSRAHLENWQASG